MVLLAMAKYSSRLTLVTEISASSRLMTPERISIVACVSSKETTAVVVVVAALVPPVIVSPEVNVPEGTVIVIEVASGFVITEAVAALVPPVIVSPIVKLPLALTFKVMVPTGYSETAFANVCVNLFIVHLFKPRLDQSANMRFKDLRAVLASYPVLNSKPQRSKASSI